MAKMPSIGTSLRVSDFPREDPRLLDILSEFMGDVSDAIGGGGSTLTHGNLSLSDNIQCEVVQCVLTHGVPAIVKLKKLSYAKGVVLLGSGVEIVADITATPGPIGATAVVAAYFERGTGTSAVAFVLFQEGLSGAASKSFGAWVAPTLQNGWVNTGGGRMLSGYMKASDGVVYVRGFVNAGTSNLTIFNLPAGYRPIAKVAFRGYGENPLGTPVSGNVYITAAGDITSDIGSGGPGVSFDGISFDTR